MIQQSRRADPASLYKGKYKVPILDRWSDIYSHLHHLFLKDDFTNQDDFEDIVGQLNRRIDLLEDTLQDVLEVMKNFNNNHVHALVEGTTGPVDTTLSFVGAIHPSHEAVPTTNNAEDRDLSLQSIREPIVSIPDYD